ncbi:MAG: Ig-like domain-containing protein, partial [Patescibacteria group bacterium]|nr:Ig-like domain-containing protein [Patescibacteria group bacterium]
SSNDPNRTPGYLGTLNPVTGEIQRIGQLSTRISNMAFDASANLYGTAGKGDTPTQGLFLIDIVDASITKVMSLNTSDSGRALAYNQDDGFLYYAYGYDRNIDKIDISDPNNPAFVSTLESEPNPSSNPIGALEYIGNGEFLADSWCSLMKIDVATGISTDLNSINECSKGFAFPWSSGPILTTTTPQDNETNVILDTNLTMTFDTEMYAGSGNITIKKKSNNSTVETIDITSDQITGWATADIAITTNTVLQPQAQYYVTVDDGAIKDADDKAFGGFNDNTSWSFSTGEGYIIKTIPDGRCYEVGSAEDQKPENTELSYSNNDQSSWDYTPQAASHGGDCAVTDIRLLILEDTNTI